MIRVNLLPIEKRHPERTPLPRLISIFVGVGVSFGLLVANALFYLKVAEAETRLASLQADRDGRREQVKEYDQVKAKREEADKRKRAIESIRGSRTFLWSFEIDKLCDVINDCPTVWLTSLRCGDGAPPVTLYFGPGKMKPNSTVEFYMLLECRSATDGKINYTEFGNKLEEKFLPPPATAPGPVSIVQTSGFRFLNDPDLGVEAMTSFVEEVALKYTLGLVGVKTAPKPGPPVPPGGAGS
ncbi:MAG: hypothetical protein HZA54_12680 [Planctomycetes bacterium]|nr:hypothetical protein [Planctomycetota bacterium]